MTLFQASQGGWLNESYHAFKDSKVGKAMHLTQEFTSTPTPANPSKTV